MRTNRGRSSFREAALSVSRLPKRADTGSPRWLRSATTHAKEAPMGIIWYLLIGLFAGFLAGQIMKGRGFGLVGNLVVGVVGAVLGGFLFGVLGIHGSGMIGSLITATVGAVVLLFLIGLVKK